MLSRTAITAKSLALRPACRSFHLTAVHYSEETKGAEKPAEPAADAAAVDPSKAEIERLQKEANDNKDKWLRALAEIENVRRIAARDVENAKVFGITKFAKSLLLVADNMNLAIESVKKENLATNPDLKTFYDGMIMTNIELLKVFKEQKIVPVGKVGEKFDPNLHEAMMQFVDKTKEVGTIGLVMTVGYTMNDRIIRPAKVGYVKAPDA